MASFNKITLVGYLGRDPELRYTPAGDAVCSFSLATTEKRRDGDITTWFRVTTWRRQAEVANQFLAKGKLVYIEGRLRTNEYTDRDGNQKTALEVTCTDMQFLSIGSDQGGQSGQSSAPRQAPSQAGRAPQAASDEAPPVMDDDIPF